MRLPECLQWCPWGFMGCGRQERCFGRCNKMIPGSLFDTTPPPRHPQMCGSSRGYAVPAGGSFRCPPAGRIRLPDRKETDSVFRWVGGALGPPLEMSAESASWLRVTSGLGKFFSLWVSAWQLTSCFRREGGWASFTETWLSECLRLVPCQSWSFPLVVHFPPVCGTEFDLSLVLRSKKKSFLLMFAIRHMQCRLGGWGERS